MFITLDPREIVAHNEQHFDEFTFLPVCPENVKFVLGWF